MNFSRKMFTFAKNSVRCSVQYKYISNYLRVRTLSQSRIQAEDVCWNCGTKFSADNLFCIKCNVVQPPSSKENYFKVFGLTEDFNINKKYLSTKYRQLQTVLHPDKFINRMDMEKTISADYSALVNRAYNTLQMPLSRAIHMLGLQGIKIEEDQKVTDGEFLMEIMQLNEEVESARTPNELRMLNEKNQKVLEQIGQEISRYFQEGNLEKAKDTVIKMKYYNSVSLHINGLLRERGIVD